MVMLENNNGSLSLNLWKSILQPEAEEGTHAPLVVLNRQDVLVAYVSEGVDHGETGKHIADLSDDSTTTRDDHLGEMIVELYLVAI